MLGWVFDAYLASESHAPARQQPLTGGGGHHAELAAVHKRNQVGHLLLQRRLLLVLVGVRVDRLAARVGIAERHLFAGKVSDGGGGGGGGVMGWGGSH